MPYHRTCRMGLKCLTPTSTGGPAHLSVPPFTYEGLCANCYRAKYKRYPWPGDPRDEQPKPEEHI